MGRLDFGLFFRRANNLGPTKHQFTVKKCGKRFQRFTDIFNQFLIPQSAILS